MFHIECVKTGEMPHLNDCGYGILVKNYETVPGPPYANTSTCPFLLICSSVVQIPSVSLAIRNYTDLSIDSPKILQTTVSAPDI